jgi:hypothetical protein
LTKCETRNTKLETRKSKLRRHKSSLESRVFEFRVSIRQEADMTDMRKTRRPSGTRLRGKYRTGAGDRACDGAWSGVQAHALRMVSLQSDVSSFAGPAKLLSVGFSALRADPVFAGKGCAPRLAHSPKSIVDQRRGFHAPSEGPKVSFPSCARELGWLASDSEADHDKRGTN